jgi:hypothetical protein
MIVYVSSEVSWNFSKLLRLCCPLHLLAKALQSAGVSACGRLTGGTFCHSNSALSRVSAWWMLFPPLVAVMQGPEQELASIGAETRAGTEAKAGEQNGASWSIAPKSYIFKEQGNWDVSFESGVVAVRNAAKRQYLFAVSGGY